MSTNEKLAMALSKLNIVEEPTMEEIALAKLRSQITDLTHEDERMKDDIFLLSWLKHSSFKIDRTEKSLREFVNWWEDEKMDNLLSQDLDPNISREFPVYLDSVTKDGQPILFVTIGALEKFTKDRLTQYFNCILGKFNKSVHDFNKRRYEKLCEEAGRRIPLSAEMLTGGLGIFDCKSFSFRQLWSPHVLQLALDVPRIIVNYFPSMLCTMYFINANKFFEVCANLIRPIISRAGIKSETFDCNETKWKPVLLDIIQNDELPQELGGNKVH